MSLLIALKGIDGIVLAADSRGTFGNLCAVTAQNDTLQKAHILAAHVAVLVAGAAELAAQIIDMVKKEVKAHKADAASRLLKSLRDIVNPFQVIILQP